MAEDWKEKYEKLVEMLKGGLFPHIRNGDISYTFLWMMKIEKVFPDDFPTQAEREMLYQKNREKILKRGLP